MKMIIKRCHQLVRWCTWKLFVRDLLRAEKPTPPSIVSSFIITFYNAAYSSKYQKHSWHTSLIILQMHQHVSDISNIPLSIVTTIRQVFIISCVWSLHLVVTVAAQWDLFQRSTWINYLHNHFILPRIQIFCFHYEI